MQSLDARDQKSEINIFEGYLSNSTKLIIQRAATKKYTVLLDGHHALLIVSQPIYSYKHLIQTVV